MVLPDSRYSFNRTAKRRSRVPRVVLALGVLGAVAGIVLWRTGVFRGWSIRPSESKVTLESLWESQQYEALNARAAEVLAAHPMDERALVYNGFSYFYRGVNQYTLEEQLPLFDRAVVNLRRALVHESPRFEAEISYVLGKSYHHKGRYYADLAIAYLERSIELGYEREDTYEYLGLAYSGIGRYARAAESFRLAVERRESDIGFLALAQAYYNAGELSGAEEYLQKTLERTTDAGIATKSRFLLGRLYLDSDELSKAEEQYRAILEADESADAYFFLGEIYDKYGDAFRARDFWRKAYAADKTHYGARLRLFG
jgi:tetratricopeptide (TPR) repeat protein